LISCPRLVCHALSCEWYVADILLLSAPITVAAAWTLAQIWDLSDLDGDGALDAEELALALFFCRKASQGKQLPASLPKRFWPPSKR
jgi:hypothetical protein